MIWVAGSIMVLCALVGVGLVIFALPGIWFMTACSAAIALWCPELLTWRAVAVLLVISLVSEVVDFIASAAGVKKLGGSRAGAIGSLVGTIVGAIVGTPVFPVLGTIVGGIVGAGAGAFICERTIAQRTWKDSARSSGGAIMGRAVSIAVKLALAITAAAFVIGALFL
ncbi:MAG: DUF456 domain-containing protein [Phycisphaerales bacterium]|nr:DUF456 domain-containing protein [Phycisphaerales bacterium]